MNRILEYDLLAEVKSNRYPGTHNPERERVRFFNVSSDESVLPLVALPNEVVKLVLEHGVSPVGTVTFINADVTEGTRQVY